MRLLGLFTLLLGGIFGMRVLVGGGVGRFRSTVPRWSGCSAVGNAWSLPLPPG